MAFNQAAHSCGRWNTDLIEGEAVQQEQRLGPGWAATAATGTVDSHFHSPGGCVFLTVYSD